MTQDEIIDAYSKLVKARYHKGIERDANITYGFSAMLSMQKNPNNKHASESYYDYRSKVSKLNEEIDLLTEQIGELYEQYNKNKNNYQNENSRSTY